jgi:hypothetical protein
LKVALVYAGPMIGHSAEKHNGRSAVTKTRKTEKEVEIHEFYVIRSPSGSLPALCPQCSKGDAIMIVPEQATVLAQVPLRTIYRWVESGLIHYKDLTNGSIVVCLKSLTITRSQIGEGE